MGEKYLRYRRSAQEEYDQAGEGSVPRMQGVHDGGEGGDANA